MSDRPKAWVSEAHALSFGDLHALVEAERAEERKEETARFGGPGTRLTVTIALAIDPIARLERIESPLQQALGLRGIVWGGGTFMRDTEAGMEIAEVDIGVSVADETEGISVISRWLEEHGYGASARIRRKGDS